MNINDALQKLANASGVMESAIYEFHRNAMNIAGECATDDEKSAIWKDARGYIEDAIKVAEKGIGECEKRIKRHSTPT